MNPAELYQSALDDTAAYLKGLARGPQTSVALSPEVAAILSQSTPTVDRPAAASSVSAEDTTAALATLKEAVRNCERCRLHKTRTQTVFGVGNTQADLVFVGEGPGEDDDTQGEPFVGKAGQLLTDIIVKGMKMRREDVYLCNVLKCRPPDNGGPNSEEMSCCEPYLVQQLSLIRPRVICALGDIAAKHLLNMEAPVDRLRGRWHRYQGIPLRVTYHPTHLLHTPEDKRKTWEDIQEVMKVLSGEVTPEV